MQSRPQPWLPFFFFCSLLLVHTFGLQGTTATTFFGGERPNCQKQKKAGLPGKTISIAASNRKSKDKNNGKGWGCWANTKKFRVLLAIMPNSGGQSNSPIPAPKMISKGNENDPKSAQKNELNLRKKVAFVGQK